ncbi:MAG: MmcQ/YjbR family DNA-binding protein [Candidatus Zixiibacteriota bacterium]
MLTNSSRYFRRIRNWCLKQEMVTEEYPWECIVYKVNGKVFAICSSETPLGITLKPEKEHLDGYLYHPDVDIASHVGRFGWITVTVHDKASADLAFALIQESYAVVVKKHFRKLYRKLFAE